MVSSGLICDSHGMSCLLTCCRPRTICFLIFFHLSPRFKFGKHFRFFSCFPPYVWSRYRARFNNRTLLSNGTLKFHKIMMLARQIFPLYFAAELLFYLRHRACSIISSCLSSNSSISSSFSNISDSVFSKSKSMLLSGIHRPKCWTYKNAGPDPTLSVDPWLSLRFKWFDFRFDCLFAVFLSFCTIFTPLSPFFSKNGHFGVKFKFD